MQTANAPAPIRDRAFAIIREHAASGRIGKWKDPLLGAGATVVCDLLIELERTFRIDLDPDELWACNDAADLVALVERKAAAKLRALLLPANENWDNMPLIDRARARRARGEPAQLYIPPPEAVDRHMSRADWLRLGRLALNIFLIFGTGAATVYTAGTLLGGWR